MLNPPSLVHFRSNPCTTSVDSYYITWLLGFKLTLIKPKPFFSCSATADVGKLKNIAWIFILCSLFLTKNLFICPNKGKFVRPTQLICPTLLYCLNQIRGLCDVKGAQRDIRCCSLFVQGCFFGNTKQTNAVFFCNIWCFVIGYHKAQLHLVWLHKCWYTYSLRK